MEIKSMDEWEHRTLSTLKKGAAIGGIPELLGMEWMIPLINVSSRALLGSRTSKL
jgi:hypothetical protein